MQVTISNNIKIQNPTTEIIEWCKTNLTIDNPDYAKKVRMGFWVGNTPRYLHLYEVHGDTYILPYGTLKQIYPMLNGSSVKSNFKEPESVFYGEPIPLYPYQEKAVTEAKKGLYGIVESKAGSGKTQMGIALIREYGRKALWVCHTLDLVKQSRDRALQYMDKDLIGTITAGKVNIGKGVTFATVQTLSKLDLSQYKDMWDVIIVDECFKGDTEILTDKGFVRFDSLTGEEKIAQYNTDNTVEFVEPIRHIKRYHKGSMVKFTVKDGRDVYMTENHVQPMFYPRIGSIKRETIGDVALCHGKSLMVAAIGTGCDNILTPMERLAIASQADGTLQRECADHNSWTIQLTKERKISRFLWLMSQLDIKWHEIKATRDGCRRFAYSTPKTITKLLSTSFDINMGSNRAKDFIREVCEWDGSAIGHYDYYYSSVIKENSELVSAIAFLGGYQSSITVQHDARSENYSNVYRVYGKLGMYKDAQRCKKRYVPYEGYVYCVEVPSHMIVVRADGFAFVSGNCHRVAGSPTQLSMFSKVLNSLSARHKYGLSATVHRADGMIIATKALLGDIVYSVPDDAIADKVMQVGIKPVGTGVKISRECLNTDGTLNYTRLINYLCGNFDRMCVIHDAIVREKDHSCLILSDRLEHLENLIQLLPPTMKPYAVMVSGKMTTKKGKLEREKAIEDMREGKKKYLFATYSLAKEGLDIPCLDRLFLTTPQKDYAVITQSIGRIARTFDGKAEPIVFDFVDDIGYLVKSYKKRCSTYKKNGCYFVEG